MQEIKESPSTAPRIPADAIAVIPVRYLVLFPGTIVPISLGREASIAAAQEAVRAECPIGLLLQQDSDLEKPSADQLFQVGTLAGVLRYITSEEGSHYMVCQGEQRFRVKEFLDGYPFFVARIERLGEEDESAPDIQARMLQLRQRTAEIVELLPQASAELSAATQNVDSASALGDFVAGLLDLNLEQKQDLLETGDLRRRLDKILELVGSRIEVLRLSHEITAQTKERMDDRQREYLLREQLKTIQKELGESEGGADAERLQAALLKAGMSEEADTHVRKELQRLERMPEAAAEYAMLLSWLEWMTSLPWSARSEENIDIGHARRILDGDHFGLDKVKRRILEHLAVRKLNPHGKSPLMCLVGPPGVGKTSLGESIARATGRKFVRVSLGGVHDEAEIRGHRRTYVGAMPGNIIQSLRRAGTRNCVMLLDEIDKLGAGGHGDPAAALLEVLDPAQNATFRDHYLGEPFDLSDVMFIATANMLDALSGPLLDRMEIIRLPGYTEEEKTQIAWRYLVPRQRETAGLSAAQCELAGDVIHALIGDYTREAGVRQLEREIGNVFRHVAMRIAEGEAGPIAIDAATLPAILGPRRFENELALRTALPGVATGLAWTPVGGDILFIEASRTPGHGKLILTGKLGDIMKESAQAAFTLVKAQCETLGIDARVFEDNDVHVHVPAGAMPKDGPSAGVAIHVALCSLLTGRPVANDCAMTGEISLRGMVLPVGGVKEKVLAAMRAGIRRVMLPARNRKEMEEIPEEVRNALEFIWLERVEDALSAAVGGPR
ncbi:endopeptidase La [Noviherbaspirillum galbum]|nr:endopeptidase La [Noviherbaspirillum galbum]